MWILGVRRHLLAPGTIALLLSGLAPCVGQAQDALADADDVDLTSSSQPSILDANTVELHLTAEGPRESVAGAVARIRDGLPKGASIEIE